VRELDAPLNPEDASQGTRKVPFARELWVERDDYRDDPPKDWFRLAPGREVRLRYACLVTCREVIRDAGGEPIELRCTWDAHSWGGTSPDGRTVRGTLHWVSAAHAVTAEVRLYDRLFGSELPGSDENKSFLDEVNRDSFFRIADAKLEPSLAAANVGSRVQFERLGYFVVDSDSAPGKLVWNRIVTLKDTWAKIEAKAAKGGAPARAPAPKPAPPPPPAPTAEAEIGIDDVKKVDLRVGLVKSAETVEKADKLLRLQVDVGEGRLRQILAGIRADYPDPSVLVGKKVVVVANLKPRQMKFGVSEGMILAAPHAIATFDEGAGTRPGDRIV
jgi:methionine--tRNA ligase beta chain